MRFHPAPRQELQLCGTTYEVEPHPNAVGMPYIAEGGRATVYKLRARDSGEIFALKVFKRKYRTEGQTAVAAGLSKYASLSGMRAATRVVVGPAEPLVKAHAELNYAVVMPWVQGTTWYDILLMASRPSKFRLERGASLAISLNFLTIMEALEKRGFAHTDISSGNVVVDLSTNECQLLDLEDAFFAGASRPEGAGIGTPGYRHELTAGSGGAWGAEADRHAAAVLVAEVILLSLPSLAGIGDTGLFAPHPQDAAAAARVREFGVYGASLAPRLAALIGCAFLAKSLADCPSLSELAASARLDLAALNGGSSAVVWGSVSIAGAVGRAGVAPSTNTVSWAAPSQHSPFSPADLGSAPDSGDAVGPRPEDANFPSSEAEQHDIQAKHGAFAAASFASGALMGAVLAMLFALVGTFVMYRGFEDKLSAAEYDREEARATAQAMQADRDRATATAATYRDQAESATVTAESVSKTLNALLDAGVLDVRSVSLSVAPGRGSFVPFVNGRTSWAHASWLQWELIVGNYSPAAGIADLKVAVYGCGSPIDACPVDRTGGKVSLARGTKATTVSDTVNISGYPQGAYYLLITSKGRAVAWAPFSLD